MYLSSSSLFFIDGMYNHTHLIKHLLIHKGIIAFLWINAIIFTTAISCSTFYRIKASQENMFPRRNINNGSAALCEKGGNGVCYFTACYYIYFTRIPSVYKPFYWHWGYRDDIIRVFLKHWDAGNPSLRSVCLSVCVCVRREGGGGSFSFFVLLQHPAASSSRETEKKNHLHLLERWFSPSSHIWRSFLLFAKWKAKLNLTRKRKKTREGARAGLIYLLYW